MLPIAKQEFEYHTKHAKTPKPSNLNRQYIYHAIESMPNKRIRNEIRETMLHNFTFGVPKSKWNQFKINKYQYPDIKYRSNDVY